MLMPVAIKMFIMITLCCDFFITETHDTVFLIEWKRCPNSKDNDSI